MLHQHQSNVECPQYRNLDHQCRSMPLTVFPLEYTLYKSVKRKLQYGLILNLLCQNKTIYNMPALILIYFLVKNKFTNSLKIDHLYIFQYGHMCH